MGGWVVAKLIYCHKSYIKKIFAHPICKSVQRFPYSRFTLINMLEGLLVSSSTIHASTLYNGSLEV